MAREEDIEQVVTFTNCSREDAAKALTKFPDASAAIAAYFDIGWETQHTEGQHAVNSQSTWDDQNTRETLPGQTPQRTTGPSNAQSYRPPDYSAPGHYPENPIDMTKDPNEDDELQRALQASLQSADNDSQQRQRVNASGVSSAGLEEERTSRWRQEPEGPEEDTANSHEDRHQHRMNHSIRASPTSANKRAHCTYGKRPCRAAAMARSAKSPRLTGEGQAEESLSSAESATRPGTPIDVSRSQSPQSRRSRQKSEAPTVFSSGRVLRSREAIKAPARGATLLGGPNDQSAQSSSSCPSHPAPRPRSPPPRYDASEWGPAKRRSQQKSLTTLQAGSVRQLDHQQVEMGTQAHLPPSIYELIQLQRKHLRAAGEKIGRSSQRGKVDDGNANMDEDDAMDRAIANSLELSQNGSNGDSQLLDLPEERRQEQTPIALTSHIPALLPVAYTVQALLSTPAACKAFFSIRPIDDRIAQGLSGYHRGASPANLPYRETTHFRGLEQSVRLPFDTTWRLQLLCAFCLLSSRARCNVGDLLCNVPQDVLRLNSKGDGPGAVVSPYYDRLVTYFYHAARFVNDTQWKPDIEDEGAKLPWDDLKTTFRCTFQKGSGPSTSEEGDNGLTLRPNDVASSVTSAIQAFLDTQNARMVQIPKVLAIDVKAQEQQLAPGQSFVPFQVEPHIFLDRFLVQNRDAVDAVCHTSVAQVKRLESLIAALEERREQLRKQSGASVVDTLTQAIEYLDLKCQPGDDPIRVESRTEASKKLRALLDGIQTELNSLEGRIATQRSALADLQRQDQERQRLAFDEPNWKRVKYSLRAVIMTEFAEQWVYFKTQDGWWRNFKGLLDKVAEEEVLSDRRGSTSLQGVTFLLYDQNEERTGSHELKSFVPEILETHIDQDNDLLESTLLSLQVPDDEFAADNDVTMGAAS